MLSRKRPCGGRRSNCFDELFPLSVSADGRYLVTATGTPFLLVADSCQGGAIESVADFTYYCQQRAAEGFNCNPA